MKTITFQATGIPKGQPRPRAFARRMGDKFVARVYDAGTAEGWKGCVADAAKAYLPEVPIDLPIKMSMVFVLPRPKAHFNSKGVLKLSAPMVFTNKPDCDNLSKAVLDALTVIGMWRDDSQIYDMRTIKRYGSTPGATISIEY